MAIRTIKLTPNQTRIVYELVLDRKNEIEDLSNSFETTLALLPDAKFVKDYEIVLKQILSQLEKKI
jgi:hypothetical protein